MDEKDYSTLTNQELVEEAKKKKLSPVANAFFIGFLFGIVIYSVAQNTWGFLTLIPLFLIYIFVKESKKDKELKKMLKDRGLE